MARRKFVSVLLGLLTLIPARPLWADPVNVAWDPSQGGAAVAGYVVYVGTQSGAYTQNFDVGNTTAFTYPAAVAGQRYYFAIKAYTSTSIYSDYSTEISGFSNAPPSLTNPGPRTSNVGAPVSLQLVASDPYGQPLTYSATGLPAGLTLQASTGLINGAATTVGTYTVNATASDGALSASQSFTWTVQPAADVTKPSVSFSIPTAAASYATSLASLSIGGTATDNVGVTQVTWGNDRGGSGTTAGTASWSAGPLTLQVGVNVISVVARDAAGNSATATLTATYTPNALPSVTISTPVSGASFPSGTVIAFAGAATDAEDGTLSANIAWSSNLSGPLGTGGSITSTLASGTHVVKASITDSAGATSTAQVTVTVSAPPPPPPPPAPAVVLSAVAAKARSQRSVNLTWTSIAWTEVNVYRNGALLTKTTNTGSWVDALKKAGTYRYKICDPANASACSNEVTVAVN